ncbi:ankyrin [Morchella conica CCBAS932]|uniref:Ankyrin n=1 Tax=Morchella conica CCBAS932 TaxID=1392247 RepID=A0A3N4KZT2_9PEZI|nr:ankyrin [Morchella conica CCBAS932]
MYHSYHHRSSDPLLLEFTNATPEPEFEAPSSSSSDSISPLLEIPIELLTMVATYLDSSDLFSLLLTAKALPFWLLPMALPLRLPLDRTLLHYAAEKGSPDCMRHILCDDECLALLNTPDNKGETPLHIAAKREDQRMCEVLLEAGADIDARNTDDETPIFCAVEAGRAKVVRILRVRGADLRAVEKNNKLTAEQKAVMYGREDVILAIRCEEGLSGERGYQQLEVATAHGFVEIVNRMIREGKNPFEKGGSKALSVIACWRSGGRIFEELGEEQETSVAPELLVRKKRRGRWEDLEDEHVTSPFEKRLKLMNF